jgi:hypothetical protein
VTAGFPAAQALAFNDGPEDAVKRVDSIVAEFRADEQRLLSERSRVSEQRATHSFLITSAGGVLQAVLLAIAFLILDRRV